MDVEVRIWRIVFRGCFLDSVPVAAAMGVDGIGVCLFFFAFSAAPNSREESPKKRNRVEFRRAIGGLILRDFEFTGIYWDRLPGWWAMCW